ncbi:MAG: hypothetical protein LWX83_18250, partial [Anaerolineae bacterium]|nr:hypothetical protein [Anaerolineae bacterium]
QVHPAAVMVAALVGLNWLGIIGVILAAPVLATIKLLGTYALMKLMDKNPWDYIVAPPSKPDTPPVSEKIKDFLNFMFELFKKLAEKIRS